MCSICLQRTTLLQLLCTISDVKTADLAKAYLYRKGKKIKEGFYKLFITGDTSEDVQLESGDSLFIPLMLDKNVYILGAVNTPKAIEYREGMRVMEAILEAGGFTKFADQNDVVIRRKDGKDEILFRGQGQKTCQGRRPGPESRLESWRLHRSEGKSFLITKKNQRG